MTTEKLHEKLLIKPVKNYYVSNEIHYNNILKDNNDIYGIINDCKTFNYLSICKNEDIVNISNSTCIPNLLKSSNSSCNKINSQHIPTVDEISQGLLFLNNFDGIVNVNDTPHSLKGTFLAKFHNTTITINDRSFISREASTLHALPAILQPTPAEGKYKELLSLEMMKEMQVENTNQIELLQTEKKTQQIISYGLITLIIIILTIMLLWKFINKRNTRIIIQNQEKKTTQNRDDTTEEKTKETPLEMTQFQTIKYQGQVTAKGPNTEKAERIIAEPLATITQHPVPNRRKFYETPFF